MQAAYIVSARRTSIGNLGGGLQTLAAHELGEIAVSAALADANVSPDAVEQVILGQVLSAGHGMNPARQAARAAGIGDHSTAFLVNQVCGSGLRAVALAAQQIQLGEANIIVAGGQESMSRAPHVVEARAGKKLGDLALVDTVMRDGLSDAFYGYPMGVTAENVAKQYSLTREGQDKFALNSQQKATQAQQAGRFGDEIAKVLIKTRKGDLSVDADEFIRPQTSLEGLAKLRPAFDKEGTVTAGNASGVNDGAASLVVMSESEMKTRGVKPMARVVSVGLHGLDPTIMGLGPIGASKAALAKAGWSVADVDLWEVNEAFAAQSMAVIANLELDMARVNVNGGAIALGHPIGASGARVLVTLLHEMERRDAKKGVATLCIGGGMGIALCVER